MIVDDDVEVHNVTKLALGDFKFDQRSLEFLSVYSSNEAREFIQKHPDTAVVLLDVVMEEEDSGLKLVEYIRVGIGLNTGALMLGTVGGESRMDSTVISDAVNLTSRLESLIKLYGANLLIGENTYDRLADISEFSIRKIGLVQVKGKSEPVRVYEVTNGDDSDVIERKCASLEAFGAAYDQYLNQDFEASISGFQAVVNANPEDRVSQMYLKRSIEFAESGVPRGWTGVEVVDFKP